MIVSWNTTNACNMYCDHCYRDAGCKAEEELSTAEAKTLLEQIARANFFDYLGYGPKAKGCRGYGHGNLLGLYGQGEAQSVP